MVTITLWQNTIFNSLVIFFMLEIFLCCCNNVIAYVSCLLQTCFQITMFEKISWLNYHLWIFQEKKNNRPKNFVRTKIFPTDGSGFLKNYVPKYILFSPELYKTKVKVNSLQNAFTKVTLLALRKFLVSKMGTLPTYA